ncbi:cytidylyltransferase domain-containing protein [Eggerthella sp. YY7918]|uniref:cytidylyltransferase domain-containing protein n=1 Tax=Eggerthella sp. (strain YY7918) TaxID=502558 RepID=UPI000217135D|nr:cytidyltransferase [Eggerthella sp. YY7918]BAK44797.1 CMP-N-acetylneuraminic acid synthetase [Eggerthella sp. YY7918]
MKVLAVIPARAASRRIPNKCTRLVAGRPLVYYAINNALQSQFIDDIIVTTDSEQVRVIAQQLGARVHWRCEELCGDEVPLDPVVFDAIPKDEHWDYIVTMQPTAPVLSVSTLDDAIRFASESDLDTLISVFNQPCLSWIEKDGKRVPEYQKRLNSQYLPPRYIETGAFIVSKSLSISATSLIGEKCDVFEISEHEARNVNRFDDLYIVSRQLEPEKVAIYVNGNNKRGIGHIYRALEIADEFYTKPDIYFDSNQTTQDVFGQTSHRLIPVDGIAELFQKCRENRYKLFINDILTTTIDYMIGLRSVLPDAKIINFEDDGEGVMKADLVFNALYSEDDMPQVRAGEKYYIASKSFLFYSPIKIEETVKTVFLSFGGADPQNYSDRMLSIIAGNKKYDSYHFVCVLGRAKLNVDELLEYNNYSNIEIFYDVSNMPELMASCDIAVTSRGRTGYELAILGIPSIAIAQNNREEKHSFVCNENGFTYLGLNPPNEIIESTLDMYLGLSQNARQRFQDMLLSHDLRHGRKRVMNLIRSL